jgi:hypothetical protein
MLLRTACKLKFINYFWNFPFNIFRLQVTETTESEMADKGRSLYCDFVTCTAC